MSQPVPQSYANHSRIVPGYHYWILGVLGVNILWTLWRLLSILFAASAFSFTPIFDALVAFAMSLAIFGIAFYARVFPLAAQDRVIRLEMRLRLAQVLPQDLAARVDELTPRQLVALRFASDEEMPALVRQVLDKKLTTSKEIKQSIRSWQGDYLRV